VCDHQVVVLVLDTPEHAQLASTILSSHLRSSRSFNVDVFAEEEEDDKYDKVRLTIRR
jgi:hypothetical protein